MRKQVAKGGDDDSSKSEEEKHKSLVVGAAKKARLEKASSSRPKASGREAALTEFKAATVKNTQEREAWDSKSPLRHSSEMEEYTEICRKTSDVAKNASGVNREKQSFSQGLASSNMPSSLPFAFGPPPGFPPHPAGFAPKLRGDPYLDQMVANGPGSMPEVKKTLPSLPFYPGFCCPLRITADPLACVLLRATLQSMQSAWNLADLQHMYEASRSREGMPSFMHRGNNEAFSDEFLRSVAAAGSYSSLSQGPMPFAAPGRPHYKADSGAGGTISPADMPPAMREQLMAWMRAMRH